MEERRESLALFTPARMIRMIALKCMLFQPRCVRKYLKLERTERYSQASLQTGQIAEVCITGIISKTSYLFLDAPEVVIALRDGNA